jgi:hypothetical protein
LFVLGNWVAVGLFCTAIVATEELGASHLHIFCHCRSAMADWRQPESCSATAFSETGTGVLATFEFTFQMHTLEKGQASKRGSLGLTIPELEDNRCQSLSGR